MMQMVNKDEWKLRTGKMLVWNMHEMQKAETELLPQVGQFHLEWKYL